jgi:hypothetical protein
MPCSGQTSATSPGSIPHRSPIPDLVIAAAAESAISEVTGQAQDWVVPRGTLEPPPMPTTAEAPVEFQAPPGGAHGATRV